MVIKVKETSESADTASQGARLFEVLAGALSTSVEDVVVSFDGVQTATSSFVNSAFLPLLTTYKIAELKRRVKVVRSTRQINDMIKNRLERAVAA